MNATRREFLAGIGGGLTLAYLLDFGIATSRASDEGKPIEEPGLSDRIVGKPNRPRVDFRDWLQISTDGHVTVYTARTEIGQGLTTVLYDLVSQGLELPHERVGVVLGDTDLCPSDGPTTGSAATLSVGWAFRNACYQIRADLLLLAADVMELPVEQLDYRSGEIVQRENPGRHISIGELADGQVRRVNVGRVEEKFMPAYVDRGTLNVNADAIVTGTMQFAGDYYPDDCLYGGILVPEYHYGSSRLEAAELAAAKQVPGIVDVYLDDGSVVAIGESFYAVEKSLAALEVKWRVPERPARLDSQAEIRAGAKLNKVIEDSGDAERALENSYINVAETYTTQYASQVPMETNTAVCEFLNGRTTIRIGTQNPFMDRYIAALELGVQPEDVHVISMACGGGFGQKTNLRVGAEAARMSRRVGRPVKYVYSRLADIQKGSFYKEAVVVDISTGVNSRGKIVARIIDFHQDEGFGSHELYEVENTRTHLYHAPMPTRHATVRGTSYTQNVFAIESHTDMVAKAAGLDPLEFRRRNIALKQFLPMIDACALMLDHPRHAKPKDHGVGFAICRHGGRQLGVVGAEVRIDPGSGRTEVLRMAGTFDIGTVINRNTATMGIKGAMIWGLSIALFEEVQLDGHHCQTTSFGDYRIARMRDVPPIEIQFFDAVTPGRPRGCGEMPTPPTIAAVANAVADAASVRIYQLPITPARLKAAIEEKNIA